VLRKIFFFPFSLIYLSVTTLRNFLFNRKINRSIEFDFPIIGIGNLSIGGSGKTPLVEFILRLTREFYSAGVLSRGYGRRTTGFHTVTENDSASKSGDEPFQLKNNFPEAHVCVCEDRALAVPQMLDEKNLDLIIMDDAFQHRWVKPGLNILVSDFNVPFFSDMILPSGNLRESRCNYHRADVIVFSRCENFPNDKIRKKYLSKIPKVDSSKVFFTSLEYGTPYSVLKNKEEKKNFSEIKKVILVCGIAKPKYIEDYLKKSGIQFESFLFGDHHSFSHNQVERIIAAYKNLNDTSAVILTTEKDAMRLMKFREDSELLREKLFALPMKMKFEEEEEKKFSKIIFDFVKSFKND